MMRIPRTAYLLSGFLLALPQHVGAQEKVLLKEQVGQGEQWRIKLNMELTGKVLLKSGQKSIHLDLSAHARHVFHERALGMDADGLPTRLARFYEQAGEVVDLSLIHI